MVDFASSGEREVPEVLAAAHIAFRGVGRAFKNIAQARIADAQWRQLLACAVDALRQLCHAECSVCHDAFKRAEPVAEFAFAAATAEGEVGLKRPSFFIVGKLHGWEDGSRGFAFEFAVCRGIVGIVGKGCVVVFHRTRLECCLPVDRKVCAIGEESHTCGIAVNAVDSDACLTAHHAVERHVLVGVGEHATGLCTEGKNCSQTK